MDHTRYDKQATDDKISTDYPVIALAFALVVFAYFLLNGLADWASGCNWG